VALKVVSQTTAACTLVPNNTLFQI